MGMPHAIKAISQCPQRTDKPNKMVNSGIGRCAAAHLGRQVLPVGTENSGPHTNNMLGDRKLCADGHTTGALGNSASIPNSSMGARQVVETRKAPCTI